MNGNIKDVMGLNKNKKLSSIFSILQVCLLEVARLDAGAQRAARVVAPCFVDPAGANLHV